VKNLFLILIVVAAIFLRFWNLSSNPPSLTWDEAAWGYNAYSLGIDGRDEFGKFLPLTYLESFGDFKPPLYAYLSVLPVKLFGLTEFSTRFASAFFGVLTVLLTYFLVRKIFSSFDEKFKIVVALLSAVLLAISPWHILLSRAAFEANVSTFFIVCGVYLFLLAFERRWILPISIFSFVLSMYTFNTARIIAPLLVFALFAVNTKFMFFKMKLQLFVSIIFGAIIFIPLFLFLLTPQAQLRFQEVNIFSDPSVVTRANQEIKNDNNSVFSKALHNRRFVYGVEYLRHYFDNLNPQFLFIKGDGNPKFSIQDVGQMYIWEIPFFLVGIFLLFRKREGDWWTIPYWLFIGIFPAASARETPHALRIETILPTFQILTAYGLYHVFDSFNPRIKGVNIRNLAFFALLLVVVINFLYFYHNYTAHYAKEYSREWQHGYKDALSFVEKNEASYDRIVVTEALGRPYIYSLFYTKYSPEQFRKEAVIEREALGFVHVNKYSKFTFTKNVSGEVNKDIKSLYIDTPDAVPPSAHVVERFKLLNGNIALVAYD